MKNLTLIKKSPCVQLGHLYEHLYCHELTLSLFDENIFEYADYDLIAHTYHGGIIYININFYSEKAIKHAPTLAHMRIPVSDDVIHEGFSEIESELQEILGYTSFEDIADGLHELQKDPWRLIDDIGIIDTRNIRRKAKPFYVAEGKFPRTKKMTINFILNPTFLQEHYYLLPLFRELSLLIGRNFQNTVAKSLSVYPKSDSFISDTKQAYLSSTFATYPEFDVNLEDLIKGAQQHTHRIKTGGGFDRLTEHLQNLNYRDDTHSVLDVHALYKDTIQIIGSKGWQKISTKENCDLLLQNMSIEIKFGRQKISTSLIR